MAIAANSIALLRFDASDLTDTIGTYVWVDGGVSYANSITDAAAYRTNVGEAPQRGSINAQSTANTDDITGAGEIAETIVTAQFYYEHYTGGNNTQYLYATCRTATHWLRTSSIQFALTPGNWSYWVNGVAGIVATSPFNDDTVYHLALVYDSVNCRMYKDGVQVQSIVEGWQPTSNRFTLMNHSQNGIGWGQEGYYDEFRLSDADMAPGGFPTVDPADVTTNLNTISKKW